MYNYSILFLWYKACLTAMSVDWYPEGFQDRVTNRLYKLRMHLCLVEEDLIITRIKKVSYSRSCAYKNDRDSCKETFLIWVICID